MAHGGKGSCYLGARAELEAVMQTGIKCSLEGQVGAMKLEQPTQKLNNIKLEWDRLRNKIFQKQNHETEGCISIISIVSLCINNPKACYLVKSK